MGPLSLMCGAKRLEWRTNAEGGSSAARQRAAQYRFFLVDTKEEVFSRDFRPNERFVVPNGLNKFYVDEKITNWHEASGRGDDFFEEWWPIQNDVPYRVGDFDEGRPDPYKGQTRLSNSHCPGQDHGCRCCR